MSEIADALDAMLVHPGWHLYMDHVADEWGPKAYAQKLKAAVQQARAFGKDASQAIELIDAGNEAVAEMMRWPAEHVARLKRQDIRAEPTLGSRRGGL